MVLKKMEDNSVHNKSDTEATELDLQIIRMARIGNRSALGQLAEVIHVRLTPFFYRQTGNYDLSNDLLQETLLATVKYICNLKDARRFWAWIYRIARSKLQQHYREKSRDGKIQLSLEDNSHYIESQRSREPDGLNYLVYNEALGQLKDAVNELEKQSREIIQLRGLEQLPYAQIAPVVECNIQQARVKYHRAKNRLKRSLAKLGA